MYRSLIFFERLFQMLVDHVAPQHVLFLDLAQHLLLYPDIIDLLLDLILFDPVLSQLR